MKRTNVDNQEDVLKKKIRFFFQKSRAYQTQEYCPIKDRLASSLDKWSLFILYNLGYNDVMRFNELKSRIDGISSRMLSITLKRLEGHGKISRRVYPEVPPKVEYRLTPFGQEFSNRIIDLSQWYIDHYREDIREADE